MEHKLTQLIDKALSRRSFLAGASATVAGGMLIACSDNSSTTTTTTPPATTGPTYNDLDYLNFALNLEYLEAEFYLRAATGNGLTSADTGNATSNTKGGSKVPLTGANATVQAQYLYEIAQNELDHVRFLRATLATNAVSAPAIDLTASFNTLATAAGLGSTFNPFDNYNDFLIGAFIFEDVGVTAYHGAATVLSTKSPYLQAAAEIHAVEAYHAASIRTQIVATDAANGNSNLTNIAIAVQKVRASLSGASSTTETFLSPTTIVNADAKTSIGYKRTPDQVMHIVYGQLGSGAGVSSGLFFPSGLNGNIKQTNS